MAVVGLGNAGKVTVLALACAIAPSQAVAITPGVNQTYANRVAVEAPCSVVEATGPAGYRARSWLVVTIDPKRVHGGPSGGVEIAPAALPRVETLGDGVVDDFSAAPYPQGYAEPADALGACTPQSLSADAETSGSSVLLGRPGPYVFMKNDFQTEWIKIAEDADDPVPSPCSENDGAYHESPEGNYPTQDPGDGFKWAVDTFCNIVDVIPFNVRGNAGSCPASGDMSQWPAVGHINQYDTGAAVGLPTRFGQAGGNACGPSSLLMSLLRAGTPSLPALGEVFDAVMQKPRDVVAPNGPNAFVPAKAVAYLQSIGFRQARVIPLGTNSDDANVNNVAKLYQEVAFQHPVLVSTAFGTRRWGVTGGGHMIAVTGIDNGNFVVMDPAGNFFGSQTNHYGAGKCGYGVTYPVAWVKASIVGRYIVRIGAHTPLPRVALRASSPAFGSAVQVTDTHPESADNARTFYLVDTQGRRAGWIDGTIVEEIPDSYVGKEAASWSEPASGDPDFDLAPEAPPPPPRAIVVPDPDPGLSLRVLADAGSPFALTVDGWVDGDVVGHDDLTGTGTGQEATLTSAALVAAELPPAQTGTTPTAGTSTPPPTTTPTQVVTPAISGLAISPRAFTFRRGARVTFRLNVPATVRFTVQRRKGRRFVRVRGSFTRVAKAGTNRFIFRPSLAGRVLRAARYRLVAVPSAGGRTGAAARATFRVNRR